MNEEYIQRLIEAGFFDFETAESMLTKEVFTALKNLKLHQIIMVLIAIRNDRNNMDKKDKRIETYDIFEGRILRALDAVSFWIEKQNLLKMIQYKE